MHLSSTLASRMHWYPLLERSWAEKSLGIPKTTLTIGGAVAKAQAPTRLSSLSYSMPYGYANIHSFTDNWKNGNYSKLSGILVTDDNSPSKQDKVLWVIKGDDKILFESGEQKAGMSQMTDVDLFGVNTLTIEIRRLSESEKGKDIWAFFGNALLQ